MLVWLVKQVLCLRQALLGRNHPRQLAWGLALGILIGLVPKGNLLAFCLIGGALMLRINHSMLALAAVAASFAAVRLDPWTHRIGRALLEHPEVGDWLTALYHRPLGAWTDLNNTVVLGSLIVGLASVAPSYTLSMPVFRRLSRRGRGSKPTDPTDPSPSGPPPSAASLAPQTLAESQPSPRVIADGDLETVAVETQIDIIRLRRPPAAEPADENEVREGAVGERPVAPPPPSVDEHGGEPSADAPEASEVNEALRYLVRHVRNVREGKAA